MSDRELAAAAAMVEIDLNDPSFWSSGLELIDMRLREAETLAATSAR